MPHSVSQNIDVVTFGCRLNTYESEVIRQNAIEAGLENAVIINTCAVTREAERQARQTIRKLAKNKPGTTIIVTGCSAQVSKDTYASMEEVSFVLGNTEKLEPSAFENLHISRSPKVQVGNIFDRTQTLTPLVSRYEGIARAFVEIQNGCNHRCTFCSIPYGRGNSRSVPLGEIISQIAHLVEEGYQEIVLTGVDITDYGQDLPGTPTLGKIVKRIFRHVPSLPRLRLSSLDPVEIDEDLYKLIGEEPRLMPHIHLSIQAGHTLTLKRMKRRHSRENVLKTCARIKDLRPSCIFGADFIAGFPTETQEMFQSTLDLVEEADLTYLHVFPYSIRPNTPAARMPQVPKPLIKERASILRNLGNKRHKDYLSTLQGETLPILVESLNRGRTETYASVEIPEKSAPVGTIVQASLHKYQDLLLRGEVASDPLFPHVASLNWS